MRIWFALIILCFYLIVKTCGQDIDVDTFDFDNFDAYITTEAFEYKTLDPLSFFPSVEPETEIPTEAESAITEESSESETIFPEKSPETTSESEKNTEPSIEPVSTDVPIKSTTDSLSNQKVTTEATNEKDSSVRPKTNNVAGVTEVNETTSSYISSTTTFSSTNVLEPTSTVEPTSQNKDITNSSEALTTTVQTLVSTSSTTTIRTPEVVTETTDTPPSTTILPDTVSTSKPLESTPPPNDFSQAYPDALSTTVSSLQSMSGSIESTTEILSTTTVPEEIMSLSTPSSMTPKTLDSSPPTSTLKSIDQNERGSISTESPTDRESTTDEDVKSEIPTQFTPSPKFSEVTTPLVLPASPSTEEATTPVPVENTSISLIETTTIGNTVTSTEPTTLTMTTSQPIESVSPLIETTTQEVTTSQPASIEPITQAVTTSKPMENTSSLTQPSETSTIPAGIESLGSTNAPSTTPSPLQSTSGPIESRNDGAPIDSTATTTTFIEKLLSTEPSNFDSITPITSVITTTATSETIMVSTSGPKSSLETTTTTTSSRKPQVESTTQTILSSFPTLESTTQTVLTSPPSTEKQTTTPAVIKEESTARPTTTTPLTTTSISNTEPSRNTTEVLHTTPSVLTTEATRPKSSEATSTTEGNTTPKPSMTSVSEAFAKMPLITSTVKTSITTSPLATSESIITESSTLVQNKDFTTPSNTPEELTTMLTTPSIYDDELPIFEPRFKIPIDDIPEPMELTTPPSISLEKNEIFQPSTTTSISTTERSGSQQAPKSVYLVAETTTSETQNIQIPATTPKIPQTTPMKTTTPSPISATTIPASSSTITKPEDFKQGLDSIERPPTSTTMPFTKGDDNLILEPRFKLPIDEISQSLELTTRNSIPKIVFQPVMLSTMVPPFTYNPNFHPPKFAGTNIFQQTTLKTPIDRPPYPTFDPNLVIRIEDTEKPVESTTKQIRFTIPTYQTFNPYFKIALHSPEEPSPPQNFSKEFTSNPFLRNHIHNIDESVTTQQPIFRLDPKLKKPIDDSEDTALTHRYHIKVLDPKCQCMRHVVSPTPASPKIYIPDSKEPVFQTIKPPFTWKSHETLPTDHIYKPGQNKVHKISIDDIGNILKPIPIPEEILSQFPSFKVNEAREPQPTHGNHFIPSLSEGVHRIPQGEIRIVTPTVQTPVHVLHKYHIGSGSPTVIKIQEQEKPLHFYYKYSPEGEKTRIIKPKVVERQHYSPGMFVGTPSKPVYKEIEPDSQKQPNTDRCYHKAEEGPLVMDGDSLFGRFLVAPNRCKRCFYCCLEERSHEQCSRVKLSECMKRQLIGTPVRPAAQSKGPLEHQPSTSPCRLTKTWPDGMHGSPKFKVVCS